MGWRAGFHSGYIRTAGFHHGFQQGLRPNGGFQIGTVTAYAGASMSVFLVYHVPLGTRALAESQRCITLLRGRLQGYTSVGLQAEPVSGVILPGMPAERRSGFAIWWSYDFPILGRLGRVDTHSLYYYAYNHFPTFSINL